MFKLKTRWGTPCVVHLSTHSFTLDATNSPFSKYFSDKELAYKTTGLMFTGASHTLQGYEMPYEMNDGLLYAEEIALYDFSYIDLLVLSACQTGLGEIGGDGVYGLQRGFKIAGVNTIVMSLWEVSDAATEVLMTKFYSLLAKGKSKREAFDAAVGAVKKEYESPEYWAAFIMLD
jgi:CHAT domain-containing protein